MNEVLVFLWESAWAALGQMALLLGPALLLGFILHGLSEWIRASCARLIRADLFVWLTAPGTISHELGHAFFCLLFGHRIERLELFRPRAKGRLGEVAHSYNPRNPVAMAGHFFIGTGPIWFGAALIYGLGWLLLGRGLAVEGGAAGQAAGDWPRMWLRIVWQGWRVLTELGDPALWTNWRIYVFFYLSFSIGAHMTLSPPDLAGSWKGLAVLAALMWLLNALTLWAGGWMWAVCEWVMGPMTAVYGVLAFVACLSGVIGILLALAAGAWGGPGKGSS